MWDMNSYFKFYKAKSALDPEFEDGKNPPDTVNDGGQSQAGEKYTC